MFKWKIKCALWRKKEAAFSKPPQQNWPGVEMDGVQKHMHSFLRSPPTLYLTVKAALLLLTPGLVTCPPYCHMVVEEAELGRPVVSVLVDNGSLVSCCGDLQWSAASLSTLHSTSFPALPWTLHVRDAHTGLFSAEQDTAFHWRKSIQVKSTDGTPLGSLEIVNICQLIPYLFEVQ